MRKRGVTGRERASVGLRRRLLHQLSLPSLCMVQCLSHLPMYAIHCIVWYSVSNSPISSGTTPISMYGTQLYVWYTTTSTLTPWYYLPCRLRIRNTHFTYTQFLVEIVLSRYLSTISHFFFSFSPSSPPPTHLFPALYHRDHFFLFLIQTKKVETWGDLLFPVSHPN